MAITYRTLRSASYRTSRVIAKSLSEAKSYGLQTAFLCHSHKDKELAIGLQNLLKENGWNLYIDWQDNEMPEIPDNYTANKIKSRIVDTNWFLFLATQNSTSSRWCPWEIGYADSAKQHEKIIIVPTEDDNGRFYGNEYLQLYRKLTDASNTTINKSGYAVFSPGATQGGSWVEQL